MTRAALALATFVAMLLPLGAAGHTKASFDNLIAATKAESLVDLPHARSMAAQAATAANGLADPQERRIGLATAIWLQAEMDSRLEHPQQAEKQISVAYRLVANEKPQGKLVADILLTRGQIEQQIGKSDLSLQDFQFAYRIYSALGNSRDVTRALMKLANLYWDANDYSTSLKYLNEATQYRGDLQIEFSIYNNRGIVLQELGRYIEADNSFRQALKIADRLKSGPARVTVITNMARVELKAKQLAAARSHLAGAMTLSATGEGAPIRPQVLVVAAQAALATHDLAYARRLIEQRFTGVDPGTTTQPFREAHQTAYDTYYALGDDEAALVHLAALKRLDDQATKVATQANAALATAKFDFANQELRIASLQRDEATRKAAFEHARAKTQRQIFVGSSVGLSILIGVLAFALVVSRRARRQVEAANDDLAVTNSALGKALAAKTEFLAVTSHEIRTPLNGILGMTQVMLADRSLPAETRDRLDVVHGAGVTMRALVDDILDVAKMETGKLTIEHVAFDLCDVLRDATRMWDEQARAKGLAFAATLEACPSRVVGDAARLRQIVFNLLSNAVKFTAEGAIEMRLTHDGTRAVISVSDTGIGIAADQLDTIFESFRQADAGTTRQFGGTGLGLAICRNLARAMGGEVAVESVQGQGTTFTVDLPLAPAVEEAVPESMSSDDRRSIIIVDRNPISRAMLRRMLQPHVDDIRVVGALADLADTDAGTILIDQNAVEEAADLVMLADKAGVSSVLVLWTGSVPAEVAAIGSVEIVTKPVAGPALIARVQASIRTPALVCEAA